MPTDKIMDVLVAWDEVHKSRYMPETDSRKSSSHDNDRKASIQAPETETGELEREMAKVEKSKSSKSGRIDWLALTKETLDDSQH